jgi:deoxyribodipyrimidine photo-lyase
MNYLLYYYHMISVHWFRRDLRIRDNTALIRALEGNLPVLPLFIFDPPLLDELPRDDPRVSFIYQELQRINGQLARNGSGVMVLHGDPVRVWRELIARHEVKAVYFNKDYEPCALERDSRVSNLLEEHGIMVHAFKDQVVFEESEVVKSDGMPYTVFTPYKKKWLERFSEQGAPVKKGINLNNFLPHQHPFPPLEQIGFKKSSIRVREYDLSKITTYGETRDFPAADGTSYLGPHLRFGTVSVRQVIRQAGRENSSFVNELIRREFFMQILFHYPQVTDENFRKQYRGIQWRNDETEFGLWCGGRTGYPLVDAGMRQLNQTGCMHNRVRMVAASFLCKHLLVDWRWGESYFAGKLLDYELSSNNGNWQWAAGTGCDAAPYFRIFNPLEQQKRFDGDMEYIKNWLPEFGSAGYPEPVVDHKQARERALEAYKTALNPS